MNYFVHWTKSSHHVRNFQLHIIQMQFTCQQKFARNWHLVRIQHEEKLSYSILRDRRNCIFICILPSFIYVIIYTQTPTYIHRNSLRYLLYWLIIRLTTWYLRRVVFFRENSMYHNILQIKRRWPLKPLMDWPCYKF